MTTSENGGGIESISAATETACAHAGACALRGLVEGMTSARLFALERRGGAKFDICQGYSTVPCPTYGCGGEAHIAVNAGVVDVLQVGGM